jgi:ABC-type dipeptide/oligopeptide/nickel transport system permease component
VSVLLGDQATAADIARVQKEYGLDKPLPVQFGYWLREVLQGNLGTSIFLQRPVTQALWERSEPTTLLALMAVAIAALIGVPCGIVSAVFRGRVVDQLFTGIAMLGASMPSFWLGIVLIQVFAVSFGWFPVSGYGAPDAPASRAAACTGAAGGGAGPAELGADHPLHARLDARRAGRRLRAHRALQGPEPKARWCSSTRCATRWCPSSR